MELKVRKFREQEDYWRIRAFLREVFLLNNRRQRSWDVCRWDYWRWHGVENILLMKLEDLVTIWETGEGRIAAVLTPDNLGEAFLQVHPAVRSVELEEEMIAHAEDCLAVPVRAGIRKLTVWVHADDPLRQEIVTRRGYHRVGAAEYQRRRPLDHLIQTPVPPAGYTVRALGDVDELPARSWASWKGFHPDEPDEKYGGWGWYYNVQRCPLYRRDLDLVAVAPDGAIASFCTVWFDDVCRTGLFEPVATHPDHLRRGLGSAVMAEGLRRLKRLGATMAYVGSYSIPAGALYASLGFLDYDLNEPWVRMVG